MCGGSLPTILLTLYVCIHPSSRLHKSLWQSGVADFLSTCWATLRGGVHVREHFVILAIRDNQNACVCFYEHVRMYAVNCPYMYMCLHLCTCMCMCYLDHFVHLHTP